MESASSGPGWQLDDDRDSATYDDRDALRDATSDTSDHDAPNLDSGGGGDVRDASDSGEAEVVPVAVAAGRNTCVTYSNGRIKCAGDNEFGAFGGAVERGDVNEPAIVDGVEDVHAVESFSSHFCAALMPGQVTCWGENASYQLTDVAPPGSGTPPITIPSLDDVVEIAVGDNFTCARLLDWRVECWGDNARGQVGDGRGGEGGSQMLASQPSVVAGLTDVIEVAAGGANACARLRDGRVFCWGDNTFGQLRRHTPDYQNDHEPSPLENERADEAVQLCVGDGHVCSRSGRSSHVTCWGRNTEGAVGDHGFDEWGIETLVIDAIDIACGAHFTCALAEGGHVECWGSNSNGQLGRGEGPRALPASYGEAVVAGLQDVVALDAGEAHACAVTSDGKVWCWGANEHGQLGDGTNEDKRAPVETLF
ncbi:RCC1 domain-containing protein [Persicimonas caeni]|uniref:RCC1 domain-containing protein n=1 Tax=Persicimonas caeni TaxID=2292766 RepID=UPI00143CC87E|nr:hypothetical protein [Persicimonas caeni]